MTTDAERTLEGLASVLQQRDDLTRDLYHLALKAHCPDGEPCDEEIECQDCTLLLIVSEELDEGDPWPNRRQA